MSTPGAHLLGRRPSKPDVRDYPLRLFLPTADPLETALGQLLASHASRYTKAWAQIATDRILGTIPVPPTPPTPPSPPPTPSGDVVWADTDDVLDQGDTGHCVGFGWAQWGNVAPVDDHFTNADGDTLYYAAKVVDGEPGQEDGSDVRSGAKVMRDRARLNAYAFAASIDEVIAWVSAHGPVVFGTDWTDDMFDPDPTGLVSPTGAVAGGHCYACVGWHPGDQELDGELEFINSWGTSWGHDGRFFMKRADMESLFASNGEACAAVELPVA